MWLQLAGEKTNWYDAFTAGGAQQAQAGCVSGGVVLEVHPAEAGECVANMCRVVDGQPAPAGRIDVGERPIRKSGALAGSECWRCSVDDGIGAAGASATG